MGELQEPLSELEPLLRAVLDDDTIIEFGWTQYTPYFNDGDPCIFRVCTPWFRTVDDADVEDTYALEADNYHPSLGERPGRYVDGAYVVGAYEGPDEARYERVQALASAIEGGAFEHVLLDAFGDHCSVVVKRDGITVDEYSHD
jgi:hypothetical protein